MKKIVYPLLIALVLGALTACGNSSDTSIPTEETDQVSKSAGDQLSTEESTEKVDKDKYYEYYDEFLSGMSLMLPYEFKDSDVFYSHVNEFILVDGGIFVMAKYYIGPMTPEDSENCDLSKIQSSEDILDNLIYKIPQSVQPMYDLGTYEYTKEILKTETINGLQMTKFKGELTFAYEEMEGSGGYIGYGIMGSDGRPYLILALDKTPNREKLESWDSLIDEIILTFKEDPSGEGMS